LTASDGPPNFPTVTPPVVLMELHSEHCTCGGGAYLVSAGQEANPKCIRSDGRPPFGAAYMSMDEWTALGKPQTTEAQRSALQHVADRREAPRVKVTVNVRLLSIGSDPVLLGVAVTENLGEGGALILTPVAVVAGEELLLEEMQDLLRTRAHVVESVRLASPPGQPPVHRVRLRFLDRDASRQVRKLLYMKAREKDGGGGPP